jgi:predicted esterase
MNRATSSQGEGSWVRFLDPVRSTGRRRRGEPREAPGDRRRFCPTLHPGVWLEPRELPSSAVAPAATGSAAKATVIQERDATIILPSGIDPARTYPTVVAFSYNGQPDGTQYTPLKVWKNLGRELGWIVYASKQYSNAAFYSGPWAVRSVARSVKAHVDAAIASLPVDRSRIILSGLSGAGNFAQYFNLTYPGYAAAVIDNSGRIPFEDFAPPTNRGLVPLPKPQSFSDSRRVALFLASPSDPMFYGLAVHRDLPYYKSLGWQTLFLSFPGGHKNAPIPVLLKGIQWLESRPSWQ